MTTPSQKWKDAREAAGLSAVQAGEQIGVHKNTIYDLENAEKDGVTLRVMKRAAAVYGVTLGDIFRASEDRVIVPRELKPLADVIRPLSLDDREAVVRNIASNLTFTSRVLAGGVGIPLVADTPDSTLPSDEPSAPLVEPRPTLSSPAHYQAPRRAKRAKDHRPEASRQPTHQTNQGEETEAKKNR